MEEADIHYVFPEARNPMAVSRSQTSGENGSGSRIMRIASQFSRIRAPAFAAFAAFRNTSYVATFPGFAARSHVTEAWVVIYKCIELHHSVPGMPPAFLIAQSGRIPARQYRIIYLWANGRCVEISWTYSRYHCLHKCKFVRRENFPAAVQYIISIPIL